MQQSIFWEEMARVEAPPMANSLGLGLIGPPSLLWHGRTKEALYPKDPERGGNLVPGILRTERKVPTLRACRPRPDSMATTML